MSVGRWELRWKPICMNAPDQYDRLCKIGWSGTAARGGKHHGEVKAEAGERGDEEAEEERRRVRLR